VFCVPVVPDFTKTFQWARELRAGGARSMVAVFFEVQDSESVLIGHYGAQHTRTTAVAAHAIFLSSAGMEGQEVLVPRRIEAAEIRAIKAAPRLMGWRYYPKAKGRELLYSIPGTIKAARRRAAIAEKFASPWSKMPPCPYRGADHLSGDPDAPD